MERRFKIALISINEIESHGKDVVDAVKENIPEGTEIIKQETDYFDTASLRVLLYHSSWPLVPLGADLEKFVIELGKPKEKKVSLVYAH